MGSGRPRSALGPARFRAVFNSSRSLELVCGDGSVAVSLRTSRGYVTLSFHPKSRQGSGDTGRDRWGAPAEETGSGKSWEPSHFSICPKRASVSVLQVSFTCGEGLGKWFRFCSGFRREVAP